MSASLVCSKEELQARLRRFPAASDFDDMEERRFVQWCNGHCFMWTQDQNGAWSCEEL